MLVEITIPYSSAESVTATIETPVEPAGNPLFQLTLGLTPGPGGWMAGAWNGPYDPATARIKADSPNLGVGEALRIVQGRTYALWMRWTAGDDTPVRAVANIKAI